MIVTDLKLTAPKGFLVLEGVNGAGKSTLAKRIAQHLKEKNIEALETYEPGATELGQKIREIILGKNRPNLSPLSELLLFSADRSEHVNSVIKPALSDGKKVICDRYIYSTLAFQGFGRGLSQNTIEALNVVASGGVVPDFVILLDLDPREGLKRTKSRNAEHDSFEQEALDFQIRLREGFVSIAKSAKEPFVIIDGALPPEKVWQEAKKYIDCWIKC